MIKLNIENKKGITLVTLTIAIIIMLIITSTLIYNTSNSAKIRNLNNMYQDVTKIKDKVDLYYANHHTIPVLDTKYENVLQLQGINPNDGANYYVVDLEALENLNLTYGQDYVTYKQEPSNYLTNLYIINERSHSVYLAQGISFEDKMYYTVPEENTEVTTNSVLSVELIENNENNASIKIYAVDKGSGIKKITLMLNDEAVKIYEYTSGMREIKSEIAQVTITELENTCYIQVEDELGNMQNSESIEVAKQTVRYVADANGNKIPVPIGFSPITTDDQGTKETGFVIKNDEDGNEFVWVPVDDTMPYEYERVAFTRTGWEYNQILDETTGQIKEGTLEWYFTENMPNVDDKTELEHVLQYGGYYIGRYEVGIASELERDENSGITDEIQIEKGKIVYNYINYSNAKSKAELLYSKENNNVYSRLCSSYSWDTALKFIDTQNATYSTNSLGGYYGQTTPSKTGYDTTHPCNIYDMGGNLYEWTTEKSSASNIPYSVRGGDYINSQDSLPAAVRGCFNDDEYGNYGFRIVLFL